MIGIILIGLIIIVTLISAIDMWRQIENLPDEK